MCFCIIWNLIFSHGSKHDRRKSKNTGTDILHRKFPCLSLCVCLSDVLSTRISLEPVTVLREDAETLTEKQARKGKMGHDREKGREGRSQREEEIAQIYFTVDTSRTIFVRIHPYCSECERHTTHTQVDRWKFVSTHWG